DDSDDEGFNLGFVFGHHFPKGFGIEADISRTIEDGDTDNNEYTVDLFSGFVTYRTPRKTHWKIKVGYSANDINLTGENNNVDGEGLVFGMGVGGKKFELEWTRYWAQKTAIDFLTFSFKIAGD
ncbi:MAG: hypothetical protein MJA83_13115, partial [Gammaproteobacteria bacterium]|nr:hypothetical protein [Gammaproteobacteria bacterium]